GFVAHPNTDVARLAAHDILRGALEVVALLAPVDILGLEAAIVHVVAELDREFGRLLGPQYVDPRAIVRAMLVADADWVVTRVPLGLGLGLEVGEVQAAAELPVRGGHAVV